MKSFLIVNHPVPSVGLGGKVEDSLLAIKKVTNTSSSTPQPPLPPPFKKRLFGNRDNADSVKTILNILETKPVAGRAITIEPQKFPPR